MKRKEKEKVIPERNCRCREIKAKRKGFRRDLRGCMMMMVV
jgi:hypothetical protein